MRELSDTNSSIRKSTFVLCKYTICVDLSTSFDGSRYSLNILGIFCDTMRCRIPLRDISRNFLLNRCDVKVC